MNRLYRLRAAIREHSSEVDPEQHLRYVLDVLERADKKERRRGK